MDKKWGMLMERIQQLKEKYLSQKDNVKISLAEIKQELIPYRGKIVLYGAGSAGIAFYNYLKDAEIDIAYFSDGDCDKQGLYCEGKKIIAPENIIDLLGDDALVIVTINTDGISYCKDFKKALLENGHKGLHARLKEMGCNNLIDYTYFRRCYDLYVGDLYNLPSCSDVNLMEQNWRNIERVYHMLEDDISRETFLKIVEFRMIDDSVNIPTFPEKDMYFEYQLFPQIEDEVFVDCGACTGSSLKDFFRINGKSFEKCISLEPDRYNFQGLCDYVNQLDDDLRNKISVYNAGVSDIDGKMKFFELKGPGTFASVAGKDKLNVVKIDSVLNGERASYIKMNIEGVEVAALKGAENTIKNYHPRLAIMGYHKTSDLWKVPLLIKEFNPEYKLYLRSYMHNIAFAYYAC